MSFTVQCTACRSKFAMPDAVYEQRIAGRLVDIPCKHCRQPIRVDGTLARAASESNRTPSVAEGARSASFGLASIEPPTKPVGSEKPNTATKKPSVRVPLPHQASGGPGSNAASPPLAKAAVRVAHAVSVPPKLIEPPQKPPSTAPRREAAEPPVDVPPMDLSGSDLMPLITDKPTADVERAAPPKLPARRPSGERKAASQSGEALAPRPRPARAPGLKATMMGVAPPANPERRPAFPEPQGPPSSRRGVGDGPAGGSSSAKNAPLTARSGLTPMGVQAARVVDVGAGRSSRAPRVETVVTKEGIAPPQVVDVPSSFPDDTPVDVEVSVRTDFVDLQALASHAPEAIASEGSVQESLNQDASNSQSTAARNAAGQQGVGEWSALSDRATLDDSEAHVVLRASETGALSRDWDAGTSDVSPQIAQSVPARPPQTVRPSRWRWAWVALLTFLAGAAGATFAVLTGRVVLPPALQAQVESVLPGRGAAKTQASQARSTLTEPAIAAAAPAPLQSASAAGAPEVAPPVSSEQVPEIQEPTAAVEAEVDPGVAPTSASAAEPAAPAAAPESAPKVNVVSAPSGSGKSPVVGQPGLAQPVSTVPEGVDMNKVQHLMNLAVGRAKNCHLGGRATGTAKVLVTFEPSGRVRDVKLQGEPIASAPVSKCILTHARAVAIKAYSGEAFTVSQSITLR